MAFQRVSRLLEHGVFRDFTWPTNLPDFGQYNLIYGWNGSGKTTLSRLFRALELRQPPTLGQASICIDNHDVTGPDFPQATLPVRVFNRDLVNDSIFPIGGGDVPPIFVIGKENVEKQKEAVRLKQKSTEADSKLSSARSRHQETERALDCYCRDRARVVKDTLRSSGQNLFNNYNKSNYRDRASEMLTDGDANSYCLSDTNCETFLAQHKGTPKQKIIEITYRLPDLAQLANITSALLRKTVVSAAIQSLKDAPEVADWTRRGLGLHKDRQADKCIFCERSLPQGRLAALEAHFSAEYEQFVQEVDEQIEKLDSLRTQASKLKLPNCAEFYDDIAAEYEAAERALRQAVDAADSFVKSLIDALNKKKAKAFDALILDASAPAIEAGLVEGVNEAVRKHNQASDDFLSRVTSARERLALNLIAADIDAFKRLQDAVEQASSDSKAAENNSDEVAAKIKELEMEIIEHRQPAEDLNNDLRQYLGHGELQVAVKNTGYSITRNGEPAQTLSEGEMTAIALLYFLKSLEDRSFDKRNGVVVLDDPVSSLDGNALFLAFGLIRERTKNVRQLILLTHDFALFRQVRNWFHKMSGQNKKDITKRPARFYMVQCISNGGIRSSSLTWVDRFLEHYESEYHYIFACVYRMSSSPPATNLEDYYHVPNVARRLLESFLAFKIPQASGELYQAFQLVEFDEIKKTRILRFLHTQSHGFDVVPSHDPSVLGECKAVLQDMLNLMQSLDDRHYSAMVKLVASSQAKEAGA